MIRFILSLSLLLALPINGCTAPRFDASPVSLHERFGPGDTYQGIRLLGSLRLPETPVDKRPFCGLSGLAWDEDAGLLYALSDQGTLFHLRPMFNERGWLVDAQRVAGYPLRDAAGQPVRYRTSDSEGLTIRNSDNQRAGDTELLVSFESRPRIVRYGTTGQWRGEVALPVTLRKAANYRNSNESLESVTLDPRWGVVTGSEVPLRNDPPDFIRIFAMDGRFWLYPLGKARGSALVDMQTLPDGRLLTLERAFVSPLRPFSISLRRTELQRQPKPTPLAVDDIAVFSTVDGWQLDNFEGLTRHREQRFFMISDNNCQFIQTTLLVYFELVSTPLGAQP